MLNATSVDRYLCRFDRDLHNPAPATAAMRTALDSLFESLEPLAPLAKSSEAKSIWLMIPRGTIDDFDDYEEMLEEGEVSFQEEYLNLWEKEYPSEICWYELVIAEHDRYRGVSLDNRTIVNVDLSEPAPQHLFNDDLAIPLLEMITQSAKESMALLKRGTYNGIVARDLPIKFRTGVVKRNDLWRADPEYREAVFEGMTDELFSSFQRLITSGVNHIGRLPSMTGNTFLTACAIGYEACEYRGADRSLVDQYLLHADGRDEGLTGRGHGLHAGPGINLDSPSAWDSWYFDRDRRGGHPWEVCAGANSTHIDLYVCHDRSSLEFDYRRGLLSEQEYTERMARAGYYFQVAGKAWTRSVEAVKFYMAIHNAGLPVVLSDADAILARFQGSDYVGIVPCNVTPVYCESLFPERYGRILDFMHANDDDGWLNAVEWLPEEEVVLLQSSHSNDDSNEKENKGSDSNEL